MGRAASVVLSLFAIGLVSLALGWVTLKLGISLRTQYRVWQDGRKK
jgi:hypothetical protein